ncbi:ABC transporter substrate-binding protein [Lihuaxuella thermophila]|uniref:Raffinose/stachyose/melibiose transport system substrate-binding protein n=1 Tax=Lihuaxuella thermophila TaxID=1173111 RepID=A0A1H8E4Y8_9BACL|nr:extracellular solute-binding protein [Lihuaxuella thermophila]SEN14515.1 raffinose/stachyose/melibiose transport system substrate-binding protein [Lihuaxuella thermophila]
MVIRPLSKKWSVVVSVMMILSLVFAATGCTASSDGGKIKLRVVTMFAGTDPATKVYQQALEDFKKKHPNVEIIDESMTATGDPFRTKVKTDFTSGNEPDVTFFFTGADAASIIKSGAVLPLNDLMAKDPEWSSVLTENVKQQVTEKDGNIYAFPITGFYEGLFVNKDLFQKYNVELPTDWNKFVRAIEVFNQNGIIPIAGSMDESFYLIEHFILSAGGAHGHNSAFQNGVDPTWEQGLNQLREIYKMNAFPRDANTIKDADAVQLFVNKKAAMMVNGSWTVGQIKDKQNTSVIPFPVMPGGKAQPKDLVAGFTSGYYLSKKSYEDESKKGMALELIKFLTTKEMIRKFAEANGGVPAADVQVDGLSPLASEGHKMVKEASSLSLPIDAQISPEAFTEIRKNIQYIVQDKKTAKEVLEAAFKVEKQARQQ